MNLIKLFHVTLDLISVYNTCKSLKKQASFGASKIKKIKSEVDYYRKLTNLFPVGLIFSDTKKETLSTGMSLILKIKMFTKIKILMKKQEAHGPRRSTEKHYNT